ncbi:uncharacterized protein LOC125306643 [Alosa alosa]|uniref:uncharacterized protein LOC125306643 n=1 Tax=Alosa alosa TaxID=278164 RepID=UPI00201534A1|nr:uncharacterized protein LOC125306643 [Alosa alosa]
MFKFTERMNDSYRFKCVLCLPKVNHITAYKNSPSNLRKHILRKHNCQLAKYCELTSVASKRKTDPGTTSNTKQLKLRETRQVSQKTVDNSILRFIVQGLQAFSLVEQQSFQTLVQDLQSNSVVMSQATVCRRIETAMTTMKAKVKEEMSKTAYIATTTDCWTARRRSFIGVTAHWLDSSSFERHSVALACRWITHLMSWQVH